MRATNRRRANTDSSFDGANAPDLDLPPELDPADRLAISFSRSSMLSMLDPKSLVAIDRKTPLSLADKLSADPS